MVDLILTARRASHLPGRRLRWLRFGAVQEIYALAGRVVPWCWSACVGCFIAGLAVALLLVTPAGSQGDAQRIAFIHVPTAWTSFAVFIGMAFWGGVGVLLRLRLPFLIAAAMAPTGVAMTVLALWTGLLWGLPLRGAPTAWDARLVVELILLVLYLGFMAVQSTSGDQRRGERAGALFTAAGLVVVASIGIALHWVRQPGPDAVPDVALLGPTAAGQVLMCAACCCWTLAATLQRVRALILEREADAAMTPLEVDA